MLARLGARLFREAYGADNTPGDMAAFVSANFSVSRLATALSSPDVATRIVEIAGTPAGYAQLRRHVPPGCVSGPGPVELWRFYVDRTWHGSGLAQRLMSAAQAAAMALGGETLWLSVWEKNPRAIAFYRKSGFRPVGTRPFQVGTDRQTDHIMAAALTRGTPAERG